MAVRREHPLERLQRDFDTLFGSLWGGRLAPANPDFELMRLWDFDIKENDKEIVVRAEIPGFEENELDLQINKDVLTIKAEKQQTSEGMEEYRNFYRSITLPPGIKPENAQATYRNGVLELHIPRAEDAQPKRIEVHGEKAATGQQEQQVRPNQPPATSSQTGNGGQQAKKQAGATASEKVKT